MKKFSLSLLLTLALALAFQAVCMEQQFSEAESLAIVVMAVQTYQITTKIVQNLEELLQLNTKLLSEPTLKSKGKKIKKCNKNINSYISPFKENPFYYRVFLTFPICFKGISYLVAGLKEDASSEQVINKYLKDYYDILGKLTIINDQI